MSFSRQASTLGISFAMAGCGGTLPPAASQPPPAEPPVLAAAPTGAPGAPSLAASKGDDDDAPATAEEAAPDVDPIAEVLARCAAVKAAPDLPVSCQVDMVDGVARMQLVFMDQTVAGEFHGSAVRGLAGPFCELARQTGEAAAVVESLYSERMMRAANCSDGVFHAWESADPATRELTSAARACQALQESNLPVTCSMGVVSGAPSLIVGYRSSAISHLDLRTIGDRVATPFCASITSAGEQAFVYLIEDERRGKGWNCRTGASSAWLPLERESPRPAARPRPSLPGATPTRAERREIASFARPTYRLLPIASNDR